MKNLFHLLMATSLVIVSPCGATSARAQSQAGANFTLCSFFPAAPGCADIYKQALQTSSPDADAVKAAYEAYGKYLKPGGPGLDESDRKYLHDNQIDLPPDLNAADLAGLHNLLADPAWNTAEAKRLAAINYLNRAVEAELYCHFNACDGAPAAPLLS